MKTATPKKRKDIYSPDSMRGLDRLSESLFKGITIERPLSNHRPAKTDHQCPSGGGSTYWTLKNNAVWPEESAIRFGTSSREHPFPHEGLCLFGFETPELLVSHLAKIGRDPTAIFRQGCKLARVSADPNGIKIELFSSLKEAYQSHSQLKKGKKAFSRSKISLVA